MTAIMDEVKNYNKLFINILFKGSSEPVPKNYVIFYQKLSQGFIPRIGDIVLGFYSKTHSNFNLVHPYFKETSHTLCKKTINFNLEPSEFSYIFKDTVFPIIACPYMHVSIEDLVGDVYIVYCNIPIINLRKIINTPIKLFDNFYINMGAIYKYLGELKDSPKIS